jgi:hypothetical protein
VWAFSTNRSAVTGTYNAERQRGFIRGVVIGI